MAKDPWPDASRFVPQGYGPDWVWRRLKVYLVAIMIAVAIFSLWSGLTGSGLDAVSGIGTAVILTGAAMGLILPELTSFSYKRDHNRDSTIGR